MKHKTKKNPKARFQPYNLISWLYANINHGISDFQSYVIRLKDWRFLIFIGFAGLFFLPSLLYADINVGGRISVDTTWTKAGSPYIISSNIELN